jgi:hypothetical protein
VAEGIRRSMLAGSAALFRPIQERIIALFVHSVITGFLSKETKVPFFKICAILL